MAVSIEIVYEGGLHCRATHGPSGEVLVTDAPVDNGGHGEAFSPTDLVATAFGTCVLTVMGIVAERNGLDLSGTRVCVTKTMASQPIRRIGALAVQVVLPAGCQLTAADRTKLENAANVCPVNQSLHGDVKMTVEFVYPD